MGNRIRELREERKLSIPAFARVIGMADRTVRHWESGRSNPTSRNASRIARALGIPVTALWSQPPATAWTREQPVKELKAVTDDGRPVLVAAIVPHPEARRQQLLMTGRRYGEERVWSWPSGHVRQGEDPADTVIRELNEELIIQNPAVVRHLGTVDTHLDLTRYWGRRFQRGYRMLHYLISVSSPEVQVVDAEELAWAEWRSLDQVNEAVSSLPAELAEAARTYAAHATVYVPDGHLSPNVTETPAPITPRPTS